MAKTKKSSKVHVDLNQNKNNQHDLRSKEKSQNLEESSKESSGCAKNTVKSGIIALDKADQKRVTKQTKKITKALKEGTVILDANRKQGKKKLEETRGLIYIGHIPHGFYEEELRDYFKQFGKVTNVKLCRSRVSGKSKGFGYVEFGNPEVAQIAADSMNNYIMFQKRIVANYVPYEKRPKGLFRGKSSNLLHTSVKTRQRKQKYSKNKIQPENVVERKAKKALRKLSSKLERLRSLGIQCELLVPDVNKENLSSSDDLFKEPTGSNTSTSKKSSTTRFKPKKTLLSKSLDSVQTLLPNTVDVKEEETQTTKVPRVKKEPGVLRGGIIRKKKEKTALKLDSNAVKKIARELIRKRGNPLINLQPSKTRKPKKEK